MKIFKVLGNQYVAIIFVMILISIITMINIEWWVYSFSIILSYLLADLIMIFFVRGGHGLIPIPFLSKKNFKKGHNYLIFLTFIILGTILSGTIANVLTKYIELLDTRTFILANGLIFILVYFDFTLTYYKNK
ncbi:MAG: hypothetical protein WC755_03315 [Candidatus Woesearchaeota archaeon]|jgi:hypothetical protein